MDARTVPAAGRQATGTARGVGRRGRLRSRTLLVLSGVLMAGVASTGAVLSGAQPAKAFPLGPGYWLTLANGKVIPFGRAQHFGTTPRRLPAKIVGATAFPFLEGYWLTTSKGNVAAYSNPYVAGEVKVYGSPPGRHLTAPIVGIVATSPGLGYWLVGSDGNVYPYGDAKSHGSEHGHRLAGSVVGMARTPDSGGYWLATSKGDVYRFGNARNHGSLAGHRLHTSIVAIVSTIDGGGYWLVGANGTVWRFGDAHTYRAHRAVRGSVTGMTITQNGKGYWLTTSTGTVYNYGDAPAYGSLHGRLPARVVAITTRPPLAVKVDPYVHTSSQTSNWVRTARGWQLSMHKGRTGAIPAGAYVDGVQGLTVSQLGTIGFTIASGRCDTREPALVLFVKLVRGGEVHAYGYPCSLGGSRATKRFDPEKGVANTKKVPGSAVVVNLDLQEPEGNTTSAVTDIVVAGLTVKDWRTYTAAGTVIG